MRTINLNKTFVNQMANVNCRVYIAFPILVCMISVIFILSSNRADASSNSINSKAFHEVIKNYEKNKTESISSSYEWKLSSIKDGVATFSSHIPGTKLLGVRGVTVIDRHISDAMAPFVNMSMAYEWIDMLHSIKAYPYLSETPDSHCAQSSTNTITYNCSNTDHIADKKGNFFSKLFNKRKPVDANNQINNTCIPIETILEQTSYDLEQFHRSGQDGYVPIDIVHQELKLPWPIAPRDILLKRHFHYQYEPNTIKNDVSGTVTVTYHSTEDDRVPLQTGYIRADAPHVLWKFQSVPPDADICNVLSAVGVNAASKIIYDDHSKDNNNSDNNSGVVIKDNKSQLLLDTFHKVEMNSQSCKNTDTMLSSTSNKNKDTSTSHISSSSSSSSAAAATATATTRAHRTVVVIECIVDSKGSIPIWFINFMQQSWPHKTLRKFRKLIANHRGMKFHKVEHW